MDVSVSHLNNRLALQLPAQLPLGLVFVLGKVEKLADRENGRSPRKQFDLIEKDHRVRCVLSERVAMEVALQEGDTIRAGGHLAFDPTHADYFLLVRDVEIVQIQPVDNAILTTQQVEMAAMWEDVRKRAEVAELVQSELPPWVEKMAPSEFKATVTDTNGKRVVQKVNEDELNKKQLARLTAAMDSDEDVELTNDLLAVAKKLNEVRGVVTTDKLSYGVSPPVMGTRYAYPTDVEDPDAYTPTGKISSDRILALVIIVALMLFLMIILLFIAQGF